MKLCPPAKSNVRFDLMRHSMDTSLGYLLSAVISLTQRHFQARCSFEHSGQSSTYLIPDWELFTLLARHLCDNARMRMETGNYEYATLWIQKDQRGMVCICSLIKAIY